MDDQDGSSDLSCSYQQCDAHEETESGALLEVAVIVHAAEKHTETEKAPILEAFLQALASDRECQDTAQTVRLPTFLFMYCFNGVLV